MSARTASAPAASNSVPDEADRSASQGAAPNRDGFQFKRPDWVLFRSVATLSQKAGVPAHLLRRLALKELVDNTLDTGAAVEAHELADGGYVVEDDGPGIPGKPEDIARLFSINRPLVSSKLLRRPTRGALGNGVRVVAGAGAAEQIRARPGANRLGHRPIPRRLRRQAEALHAHGPRPVGELLALARRRLRPADRAEVLAELDALEVLHAGALARLLAATLDRYFDHDLERRLWVARRATRAELAALEAEVRTRHAAAVAALRAEHADIHRRPLAGQGRAVPRWRGIVGDLAAAVPEPEPYQRPEADDAEVSGGALLAGRLDHLDQLGQYQRCQGKLNGGEPAAGGRP